VPPITDGDPTNNSADLKQKLIEALLIEGSPLHIFDSDILRQVLQAIQPQFDWPDRQTITTEAERVYYRKKASKINYWGRMDGSMSTAFDVWATPDKRHTYMTLFGQHINSDGFLTRELISLLVCWFPLLPLSCNRHIISRHVWSLPEN
jgi:hypothetical protein